ncbi:immunoglobulin superfamily member 1-like isoform X1 [Bufo gargarizans]|uniref:immunoglobulin superfamily member 1-like isoform X1 n=1 Tax=Bufo gargarizans TaxID=30331 RepID=UPI001CF42CED|nr:immunoglobulin superfamily member 1-like isoform X1 [Bufo gargarizans]
MGPATYNIFFIVCYIFVRTRSGVLGELLQPILEIDTEDPNDVNMIGSTAYLNCTNSLNAQKFYLRKDGNKDVMNEQVTPVFTMTNLNAKDSGLYTCQYSRNSEFSKHSKPVHLYVSDRYPPPTITAEPKSIVQPGQNMNIICSSPYPDIIFTLLKGYAPIEESDNNPFTYVIRGASKEHAGQYSCRYRRLSLLSDFSSPLMIDVKALPKPSITLEEIQKVELKISCMAPEKEKKMWFQLFNESKDVIHEIKVVNKSQVDFIVPYPNQSDPRYYCMYRIRMGSDFADSFFSDAAVIWNEPSGTQDYTIENIFRLLLSAIILILLTVIFAKHFKSSDECKSRPSEPSAPRKKLAVDSEYTQQLMEEKKNDSAEKSLVPTPPTTTVSDVKEKVNEQEEQQTSM